MAKSVVVVFCKNDEEEKQAEAEYKDILQFKRVHTSKATLTCRHIYLGEAGYLGCENNRQGEDRVIVFEKD
jgi:hypothetical protein